jgi:hypothetical protein
VTRESVLAHGQAAAEAGMADTCTIRRQTGSTLDDLSGGVVPTWTALYSGKCRVQQALAQADEQDVGEDYQLRLRLTLQLPMAGTSGLKVDDEVTITVSLDPDLVGKVLLIRDLFHKTHATARRVGVTERTGS